MSRYINADELIKDIENIYVEINEENDPVINQGEVLNLIEGYAAENVKPIVYGKWKNSVIADNFRACSLCCYVSPSGFYNFCPNCGADMRGEPNDTP